MTLPIIVPFTKRPQLASKQTKGDNTMDTPEKMKNILKLEEGRIEPIKDLMKDEKEFALRRILVDKEMGGAKNLTFGWVIFEPENSFHKKHIHPNAEEIFYILSGKGVGGVGEGTEEVEIVQGDTVWVPKGAVHWLYNPFDTPCEILFIYAAPSLAAAGYEITE
jgi:mannose-6-phosphate isomerase-like protein (cupin superfamily)